MSVSYRLGGLVALLALLSAFTTFFSAPSQAASSQPAASASSQVALLDIRHEAYRSPRALRSNEESSISALRPITEEPTALPIIARREVSGVSWLKVLLPGRPNGHSGWIKSQGTTIKTTSWAVTISLSKRQVSVFHKGLLVRRLEAVIGTPATPTPRGNFFIEELVALKAPHPGGPFALLLSARSQTLQHFDGGPGQIAIHGRDYLGGVLGSASSHGCVRLQSSAMGWLVDSLSAGDRVTIVS